MLDMMRFLLGDIVKGNPYVRRVRWEQTQHGVESTPEVSWTLWVYFVDGSKVAVEL